MAMQKVKTNSIFGTIFNTLRAQSKPLSIVLLCLAGLFILSCAYSFWSAQKDRAAQYDFSVLMTEYETISQDKNPAWSTLLEKFEKNYQKHAGSSLLPYYLNYKVRILLHQDKRDEALEVLNTIIASKSGSPMLSLYHIERALIQLDGNDDEQRKLGLNALQILAQDKSNQYRDSAQFYLGRYYWAMNDIDGARQVWQQLVDDQRDEKMSPSPWVSYVQDKLNITIV